MSADCASDNSSAWLAILRKIEPHCDRFEAEWQAGRRPEIARYLHEVPTEARPELFRQLLRLDIDYRRRLRETPTPADYKAFFAEHASRIDILLAQTAPQAPASGDTKAYRIEGLAERYQIEGWLGGGGMGDVYRARQVYSDHLVALKLIRPDYLASEGARDHFRTEAQALAKLDHPHIVRVHDSGECDGQPYLAMELVEGGTLAGTTAGGPWNGNAGGGARRAAGLVDALARAVEYAHQQGVVHRDLKPANVLLTVAGVPKIADFGLARLLDARAGLTQSGQQPGTVPYQAPEEAAGRPEAGGPAADVFGLGGILYYLLTGRPPHRGSSAKEVVEQARKGQVTPPRQLNPRVPAALERICLKALAPEPSQRYASAAVLADDLRRYLRRPWWIALAAGMLAILLLVAAIALLLGRDSGGPAPALSGELIVSVWSADGVTKRGLKVGEPGSLPVRNGEQLRPEARLNQPAHVYLLWLDSEGVTTPLYPWNAGTRIVHKTLTGAPPELAPQAVVQSPGTPDGGWKVAGKSGLDTILLLARRTPLPADCALAEMIGPLPPTRAHSLLEWALRGFDRGQEVGFLNLGDDRGPEEEAVRIDDPLLQLMGRLGEQFEMIRAVRFAHVEK
jgi:hypothetical protein